jgi:hypothetical protein
LVFERLDLAGELKFSGIESAFEGFEEKTPEQARKHSHGQKEARGT